MPAEAFRPLPASPIPVKSISLLGLFDGEGREGEELSC
jgi:hypothetical protein